MKDGRGGVRDDILCVGCWSWRGTQGRKNRFEEGMMNPLGTKGREVPLGDVGGGACGWGVGCDKWTQRGRSLSETFICGSGPEPWGWGAGWGSPGWHQPTMTLSCPQTGPPVVCPSREPSIRASDAAVAGPGLGSPSSWGKSCLIRGTLLCSVTDSSEQGSWAGAGARQGCRQPWWRCLTAGAALVPGTHSAGEISRWRSGRKNPPANAEMKETLLT